MPHPHPGVRLIACSILAAFVASAAAREAIVGDPTHAQWVPYGQARPKNVDAPTLPGGLAVQVAVRRKGAQAWDAGLSARLKEGVRANERVTAGVFARAHTPATAGETASLVVRVQHNTMPHDALIAAKFEIGSEWVFYCVQGVAAQAADVGALELSLQLASEKQTVEVGPFMVTHGGEGASTMLPCQKTIAAD